ncbi:MAG: hypothetical protein KC731_37910 [Myxococcales bacterium]|nr:hypothetical protein [Myxococcales bacterium]
MTRHLIVALLLLSSVTACDSPKESATETPSAAATSRPAIELVARKVSIDQTLKTEPQGGGDEMEEHPALEGKVWVVVTADIAHNDCQEGEEIDSKLASLVLDGKPAGEVQGGGESPEKICVLCQAKVKAGCSGGRANLRPFTFVFAVDAKADVKNATLQYKGREAKLSVAEINDRRGNDEINAKIAEKKAQVAEMKKKLEGTGNVSKGHIIEGEIAEIEREIKELEESRK